MQARPRRSTARVICLAGLIATGLVATTWPSTAAGRPLPPQGLYEGCAPGASPDACVARLATIHSGGFRYVLNYSAWYGSPADVLGYADAAAALGLRLIWPLNNPAWRGLGTLGATYPTFAGGSATASTPTFTSAIDLVAKHPATWGFYIGDELPAAEAGRVRQLSVAVRRIAPDKPQLYVARPGIGRLLPFAPYADVAGVDTYPVGSNDPPVWRAARSARVATAATGARTAMVLQAFSWSQYKPEAGLPRYPGERRLRAMRDAAIRRARPAMILWYSYQDILRSDNPRRRWQELVRAALPR